MKLSREGGVLTLRIDRPERLNAISPDDMHAIADVIVDAGRDSGVDVVVLAGDETSLCTGADLGVAESLQDPDVARYAINGANRIVEAIVECPKPVVALARGAVAGVGVPIALAADLVLCDESTYFMLSFTKVGLMPDGGASAVVTAAVGRARAMRMALLAERMTAGEAYNLGLVSHLIDANQFEATATAVVRTLASGPRIAQRRTKAAINAASLGGLRAAFELESNGQAALLTAHDFAEGALAFSQKRTPEFTDR